MANITQQLNTFLVGGAVRDALLKRPVVDNDYVVVGSSVQEMLSLGFLQVGKDFPVFIHPQSRQEYALARTEKKAGQGYTGFNCDASASVTLEEDLLRRDLSINAMAMDESGKIIDPYNGQIDLDNRVLRHVSPAFIEDPLRVLRVARFAARYHDYGFTIAPETLALMTKLSKSGELSSLSAERIWQEMERSLADTHPEVFFQVLYQCQALKSLWPDLHDLWDTSDLEKSQAKICSRSQTMMVLKQAVLLSEKTTVRFASVCYNLGQSLTQQDSLPADADHEIPGVTLIEAVCKRLRVPTAHKNLALKVCQFHLHAHKVFQLKASTILKLYNQLDVWRKPEEFDDFLLCCQADFTVRYGLEVAEYRQKEFLYTGFKMLNRVTAKPFVEQGLKGLEIKAAIAEQRLAELNKYQQSYIKQHNILSNASN
ncbi:multifunctional CCA addition/repair protein [Colwellia sp. MB02u-18]|uniref:multifunctional CCA addition/repair protein n=1 Tax=unclassified Colwellia TaxID=196834 RepID=UPI0015F6350C|nr:MULTISPECIES: multifunctional CCA addition/repair protein [unclassified Colwellia]MBA6223257.1 multifunctional CCA addition/repair protein [Colwellia sp. MB3u-45]MBA6267777.1 multifunctional CCA addition/repair protein [Colwellia sp. MB3u-43]MBA6322416.1 multifunctional CCA addition/repair protein [Colwellia sp. MB02u-19]MBA6324415.1 multifunctional CCA addition/repair protein [Colwellia sp. MB02u-18]MBA6332571.1 multifunctional CCA addition/repair protein [Colwellia sp. MB02u-12]